MEIVVVYGGVGPERDVSLVSGKAVLEGLRERWPIQGLQLDAPELPRELNPKAHLVFPALHGPFGEDGQFQKLLEVAGFTYVGSNALSSYICMQKPLAKALAAAHGVPVLPDVAFEKPYFTPTTSSLIAQLGDDLVFKPANGGSSTGVTMAQGQAVIDSTLNTLSEDFWLVEPRVRGHELTVGLLNGEALACVEIRPKGDFYDYKHKYTAGATQYLCPAPIPRELTEALFQAAQAAYRACGCRDFARADFLYDGKNYFFLELNTIPGLTPLSLLPMTAKHRGLDFEVLIEAMIAPALTRWETAREASLCQ